MFFPQHLSGLRIVSNRGGGPNVGHEVAVLIALEMRRRSVRGSTHGRFAAWRRRCLGGRCGGRANGPGPHETSRTQDRRHTHSQCHVAPNLLEPTLKRPPTRGCESSGPNPGNPNIQVLRPQWVKSPAGRFLSLYLRIGLYWYWLTA